MPRRVTLHTNGQPRTVLAEPRALVETADARAGA